jgi:hypothetical protein
MDTTNNTEFVVEQPELVITNDAKYYLHTAARWANFLGILGFIITGFTVLSALYWLVMGSTLSTIASGQGAENASPYASAIVSMMGSIGGIVLLLYAIVIFFISFYLVRFAGGTKKAVLYGVVTDLTKGIEGLKSFFKLWGIISIVAIALSVLGFIATIVFAVAAASAMH